MLLADGRELVLHIEFQGRRSHRPVARRMLEYMTRLTASYALDLCSVVFYVGRGAGTDDRGQHQVNGFAGTPVLTWQYDVIRLWQMRAEELLALDQPALLALVGQTQMDEPEVVLPTVIARLRSVPDLEMRGRLMTALLSLIPEEEMVYMVEQLLEDDELLLDTPYLRRIREAGREEGREAGREEGRIEGREAGRAVGRTEGREAGRVEGSLTASRRHIMRVLALRFTLAATVVQQIERSLETLVDEAQLERLLAVAIQSAQLTDFQAALDHELRS